MNNGHASGGFLNGLVIGVALGAGAYFLIGTKTGKKILKAVSEQGFDNLEGLVGAVTESMSCECDGECMCEEEVEKTPRKMATTSHPEHSEEAPKKTGPKRFFKGIKR